MKNWLTNNKLSFIGVLIGAIVGYFYWQQIGCVSGTCIISSKPVNSTLYGALLGYLLFNLFKRAKQKPTDKPPAV